MSTNQSTANVPLLPSPSPESLEDPSVPNVPIGASVPVRLDNLGPMVVNSDGTLSRIANWENMMEAERERTMRVLAARNRARLLAKQQKDGFDASSGPLSAASS